MLTTDKRASLFYSTVSDEEKRFIRLSPGYEMVDLKLDSKLYNFFFVTDVGTK